MMPMNTPRVTEVLSLDNRLDWMTETPRPAATNINTQRRMTKPMIGIGEWGLGMERATDYSIIPLL